MRIGPSVVCTLHMAAGKNIVAIVLGIGLNSMPYATIFGIIPLFFFLTTIANTGGGVVGL